MKKVFHIITHIDLGGAERVAINIAKGGKATGIEMHVVEVMHGNSDMTQTMLNEMQTAGIIVHRAPIPLLFRWHYIMEKALAWCFPLWFIWLWRKHRPDVIHTHTELPDIATFALYKLFPHIQTKIVRTIHNTKLWTGMKNTGNRIEKFMQEHNANISISTSVQQCYCDTYSELTPVIFNGVEQTAQRKAYTGIIEGKKNICFAGRLEEQKGIQTLCEVVKNMSGNDSYHFHIFGTGRLQSLVDELKELDNVSINPPLDNLSAYLASFDYVFMPSLHEGLATLSIEASFAGTPVLANRAKGLTDTLPHDWPLMVENNDIQQWMHIFNDILPMTNSEELAQTAYHYAFSHFTLNSMQEHYFKLYNE